MANAGSNARAAGGGAGMRAPRAGFVAAALLASLLPGCPLSDEYFVQPGAGAGFGAVTSAGTGGSPASAGESGAGGSGGSGARAGRGEGGANSRGRTGGDAATGGEGASGGSGGTGGSGNAGEAGTDSGPGSGGSAGTMSGCVAEEERCDGVSNDCDDEVDEDSACPSGCSAKRYDDHVYVLCVFEDEDDYSGADDASSRCADIGSANGPDLGLGLAWIESADENDFLKDWIRDAAPPDGFVWMGANDENTETRWVWGQRPEAEQFFEGSSDGGGTPYNDRFNDFGSGQPNGGDHDDVDCGAFDSEFDWHWVDEYCTTLEPGFICEAHPPSRN